MPMATTQEVGLYPAAQKVLGSSSPLQWPQGSFLQLTSRRQHKASSQGIEKRVQVPRLLTPQHAFPTDGRSTNLMIAQTEGRYMASASAVLP